MNSFIMLSNAIESSLNGDEKNAIKFISMAREMANDKNFHHVSMLSMAVSSEVSRNLLVGKVTKTSQHNEYATVQHWFRNNHTQLIDDSKLVRGVVGQTGKYRPDFLIDFHGELRPVECKKVFNQRSLNQLECYLSDFGVTSGYAVAFELKCNLPDYIEFIRCPLPE